MLSSLVGAILILKFMQWWYNNLREKEGLPRLSLKGFLQDIGLWP